MLAKGDFGRALRAVGETEPGGGAEGMEARGRPLETGGRIGREPRRRVRGSHTDRWRGQSFAGASAQAWEMFRKHRQGLAEGNT